MNERDRLTADLAANPAPWNEEVDPKEPGWITATADYGAQADRLIALGWTRLDEERLARALAQFGWLCQAKAAAIAKAYREADHA